MASHDHLDDVSCIILDSVFCYWFASAVISLLLGLMVSPKVQEDDFGGDFSGGNAARRPGSLHANWVE